MPLLIRNAIFQASRILPPERSFNILRWFAAGSMKNIRIILFILSTNRSGVPATCSGRESPLIRLLQEEMLFFTVTRLLIDLLAAQVLRQEWPSCTPRENSKRESFLFMKVI